MKHTCSGCKYMKPLNDNKDRTYYFCMFDQSPCFLEETCNLGWCELKGYAEDLYKLGEHDE